MMVDENFETVEVSHVGVLTPTRGFSAFKVIAFEIVRIMTYASILRG